MKGMLVCWNSCGIGRRLTEYYRPYSIDLSDSSCVNHPPNMQSIIIRLCGTTFSLDRPGSSYVRQGGWLVFELSAQRFDNRWVCSPPLWRIRVSYCRVSRHLTVEPVKLLARVAVLPIRLFFAEKYRCFCKPAFHQAYNVENNRGWTEQLTILSRLTKGS